MSKVLKSTMMFISHAKNQLYLLTSSLRYCKDIANLLFWELQECLIIPIKTIVFICRKPSSSSACKKSTSSPTSFVRYCKEIVKLLLWVIWACLVTWLCTPKVILSTCRKRLCLSASKKATSSPKFSRDITKICKTSYFGYFGQAWLYTPKMILSTCRKLQCLSECQK